MNHLIHSECGLIGEFDREADVVVWTDFGRYFAFNQEVGVFRTGGSLWEAHPGITGWTTTVKCPCTAIGAGFYRGRRLHWSFGRGLATRDGKKQSGDREERDCAFSDRKFHY